MNLFTNIIPLSQSDRLRYVGNLAGYSPSHSLPINFEKWALDVLNKIEQEANEKLRQTISNDILRRKYGQ